VSVRWPVLIFFVCNGVGWDVAGLVVGCAGHWVRSAGAVLASSITLKELLGTINFSSHFVDRYDR
jgi:hypothetical protein